jgi:2,4-dienoyl-CoA reductase (NADPH2)
MSNNALQALFEPLVMPNLTVKNRFFMAPMGTSFSGDQLQDYLVARAKGDVGLITTAEISIHPLGRAGAACEPRLESDDDIPSFAPLTRAVQSAGAKIVAQLNHTGRYSPGKVLGHQSVAPSPIPSRYTGEMPRELSTGEADDLVIAFAAAAVRAKDAGFDGIEVCGNSGYLISQFLSPLTNHRQDKYGGDVRQRATFLFSILREMRKEVGPDMNICVKFDAEDGMEGGKTLEDSLVLAPMMVQAGADRLHVWAGWHESTRPMLPMFVPRAAFAYLSAAIKGVVNVPVATVGRINDPFVAADIIASRKADMVGLGRTLLCDPDFVLKTKEGRTAEIRRCTACCYCFDEIMKAIRGVPVSLRCSFNAELGREGEGLLTAASKKKKVLVIGGGPAGMETARTASLRGHSVTLLEREEKLGGMINLAVIPPHKEELKNIIDYYTNEMAVRKVDVRLGTPFTPPVLSDIKPDIVVSAVGASLAVPQIPGMDKPHVVSSLDVLSGTAATKNTVVVIGGGMIGLETAELLADQGKSVTVIEMLKSVGQDIGATTRWGIVSRIRAKVRIMTLSKVVEIGDTGISIEGVAEEIPAETVVLATGLSSDRNVADALKQMNVDFRETGCCREPGQVADAIADGFQVGCTI